MNSWEPGASIDLLRARADLLSAIRKFFAERDVMEVVTPVLAAATMPDPNINSLQLSDSPVNGEQADWYLQTSPESAMKRLLSAACGPIFQICPAFRAGEAGQLHNPEFTLLEWYRPEFDQEELMTEVGELLVALGVNGQIERLTYQQIFVEFLDIDPLDCDLASLQDFAGASDLQDPASCSRDELLDFLLSSQIAPKLGHVGPVFICDYPASQAALARISQRDARVCERFELFLGGMEIANGYHELTDAIEQAQRFDAGNAMRRQRNQTVIPDDQRLLEALDNGMPDASGVALGLDRLLMFLHGCKDIDSVMAFSAARLGPAEEESPDP